MVTNHVLAYDCNVNAYVAGSNGSSANGDKKARLDPQCGTLVFCGTTDWANVLKPGKLKEESYHSKNNVHEPMFLAALKDVRIRHVGSGPEAGCMIVVDEEGKVKYKSDQYLVTIGL
jgi:hypothetical protein